MAAEKQEVPLGLCSPHGWGWTAPLGGLCSVPSVGRFGQVRGPHSALRAGIPSFGSPAVLTSSPLSAVEMEASWSLIPQIARSATPGQLEGVKSSQVPPSLGPPLIPHRSHFPAQVSCVFAPLGCSSWDGVFSRACALSKRGAGPCPRGCPAPGPCECCARHHQIVCLEAAEVSATTLPPPSRALNDKKTDNPIQK